MARWLVACAIVWGGWVWASSPPTPASPPFTPSPVITWGRPLDGGPLRVVCLLQGAKEEGLELLRRFDFTGDVLVSKGGKYSVDSTASSLARRQLASGQTDVFIVGGIFWKRLPATLRLSILERVQEGMGLLLVEAPVTWQDTTLPKVMATDPAPDAANAVTSGIPIPLLPLVTHDAERNAYCMYPDQQFPAPTPEQLVTGARFGKGRICVLNYSVAQSNVVYLYSLTPGVRIHDSAFARPYPYWEYCHSLLGKAVLWAAGRRETARLDVDTRAPGRGNAALAEVRLQAPDRDGPVQLQAVVRDRYHTVYAEVAATMPPGGNPASWEVLVPESQIPPGGLYFVDVWARREGRVLDWATAWGNIQADARIESLSLDRPRYTEADPVIATFTCSGDIGSLRLHVELVGSDGRCLQRQDIPAGSIVEMSFSLAGAQTLVSYLDARLVAGGRVVWRERTPVFLARGAPREFFAYSWMDAEAYYMRDYLRRIQDHGVDGVLAGGGAATYFFQGGRLAAEQNLRLVPTNVVDSRLGKPPDGDPARLPRPLTDPAVMAEENRRLRTNIPLVADTQPLGYSLMDEWALGTSERPTDYGDASLAAFRQWVQGLYPSLGALNETWGTDFARWDDVTPVQAGELRSAMELDKVDWSQLNLAAFVDYRLFMDTVGPTAFSDFAETIRQMDPGAKVGLCGTESNSTWFGYQWHRLSQTMDFVCGYGDAAATPNISRDMRGLQRELQRSFRLPGSLLSCWVGYHASDFYRDQALKLLLHDFHGIGYFGGNPEIFADFPYLDYDFTLSRRALLAGECTTELRRGLDQLVWNSRRDNSGLAILISQTSLHAASALGREAAWGERVTALTRAVEDAGFQYDFVAPEQVSTGVLSERGYRALLLPQVTCLSDVEAKAILEFSAAGGGVVHDRTPGVLDDHGKSRPVPIEFTGEKVVALPEIPGDRQACAGLIAGALGRLGISPLAQISHDETAYLPVEITVYHNGDHQLVGLQTDLVSADGKQPEPAAQIRLPSEGFVYDVRRGQALGRIRTVTGVLDPMHILLYSILPYEVEGLEVTPAPARLGGQTTVELGVQATDSLGDHFLRVTLAGPDGRERPGFSQTVRAIGGRGQATLRFALNDPAGMWQVVVRDAASGVTADAVLEVRP